MKFLLAALCALALTASGAPEEDRITSLPGIDVAALSYKMYSGFLTVDSTTNRRLFYWFAEAKSNVTEKPVVLWFNGGPGCSSLLGFLSENGPLEARNDGTVGEHGLSWNGLANTLYIESPAFVGFSTSDDSRDRQSNDTKTADDNFRALQAFYAKFPEFKSQPFYLTGESYAGNYVPQLADAIVGGDDATLRSSFAGFAVGNPVFSCNGASFVDIASKFQGELWFYHALLPIDIYTAWLDTGCSSLNPGANATRCQQLTNKMGNLIGTYDPYDLYSDPCTGNSTIGIPEEDKARCKDYTTVATAWLNRADVQAALHVIPSASHAPVAWTSCSNTLEYTVTWPDSAQYYSRVAAAPTKPRILVFSGDVDIAVCPAPTAQYCLNQFGSQRTGQWRQWTVNGYTAGYVQEYADYTYATVKGAGHLASTTQPWAMYNLLERFLSGGQL